MGAKYIRGILLEADTAGLPVNVSLQADGGAAVVTFTATHNVLQEIPYAFPNPFVAYETRLVPMGAIRIKGYKLIADDYPDYTPLITPWDNAGVIGAKFVQGMVLEAETGDLPIPLQIQGDEGLVQLVVSVQHNGRSEKPYSWEPFIAHQMRVVPQGSVRIFGIRWVFDIVPESTTTWKTDSTSFEFPEYGSCYYAYIKHISTADITLTVTIDGTSYTYTISNSGGTATKTRVVLQAVKGKLFQFGLTSLMPFRLYRNQSIVYAKPWRSDAFFEARQPFGEVSAENGARI